MTRRRQSIRATEYPYRPLANTITNIFEFSAHSFIAITNAVLLAFFHQTHHQQSFVYSSTLCILMYYTFLFDISRSSAKNVISPFVCLRNKTEYLRTNCFLYNLLEKREYILIVQIPCTLPPLLKKRFTIKKGLIVNRNVHIQ